MTENFIDKIRKIPSLDRAIISYVHLLKVKNTVEIGLITDKAFNAEDEASAKKAACAFVPEFFSCSLSITKLTPDEDMVSKKIFEIITRDNRRLAAFITPGDVTVIKTEDGFDFTVKVVATSAHDSDFIEGVVRELKKCYCGGFYGRCEASGKDLDDVEVSERHENIEYEIAPRQFEITDFNFIEGTEVKKYAIYLADLNFVAESVAVCGKINDIKERTVKNSSGKERTMFTFLVDDGTATLRIAYFARQKSIDKIRKLSVGESIVLTCKTEIYNGSVRATAMLIDYGSAPEGFVPEKRPSKPVPKYYETVFPRPYSDFTQNDFFTDVSLPDCLVKNSFVVFDLETTGLNNSPSSGNMDRIIEIGAYKIIGGEIKQSFNTFVNPERKLSEEIIKLTGIDQQTVNGAPSFKKVMPDFFKFIDGCYLVGHNAANFDYKFIDYYCSLCGYMTERKVFDTIPLSQELLRLSNYKLNTVADHFKITFNHHRAADDALVTAKIFIELIKLKKSLPNLC